MSPNRQDESRDPVREAYDAGRRGGLAIGALATSAVAFISLLGLEKALLGLTLAVLVYREARHGTKARRLAGWAMAISCAYVVTFVVVLVAFRSQLAELLHLLQRLG